MYSSKKISAQEKEYMNSGPDFVFENYLNNNSLLFLGTSICKINSVQW